MQLGQREYQLTIDNEKSTRPNFWLTLYLPQDFRIREKIISIYIPV